MDIAEQLAIDRAKQLFGAAYVNVQPHSGSQANAAVYLALVPPGSTILGMSLDHGGHLTHGAKVNFSGKLYRSVQYGVRAQTGEIDYEEVQRLAETERPALIVAGFSAYSRIIDWQRFAGIAKSIGALFFVDMAHVAGLVATGHYPNPLPHADVVTTTTHKTLRGAARRTDPRARESRDRQEAQFDGVPGYPGRSPDACHRRQGRGVSRGIAAGIQGIPGPGSGQRARDVRAAVAARVRYRLRGHRQPSVLDEPDQPGDHGQGCRCGAGPAFITVNKNAVPNDPRPPTITSGLRIGTPASTTRGFKEQQITLVADLIADILDANGAGDVIEATRAKVVDLCRAFPVYGT